MSKGKGEDQEAVEPRADPIDNAKREAFCHEYLVDFNAHQAALRAGYAKRSAGQQGHRLLKNDEIRARLQYLQSEQLRRVDMDAETWKREILALAVSDPRKLFDANGALLSPDQWPDDVARAIASVETREVYEWDPDEQRKVYVGQTQKVKRESKVRALELMAKHLNLLTDNVQLTADDELLEALYAGRRRAGLS